jgi:hypothetical protein
MTTTTCNCRHCGTPLVTMFADLGATPVSNDYLTESQLNAGEPYYPLRALVCDACFLVQLQDVRRADDLFREDYAYFSSISSSWLAHAKNYATSMTERFSLDSESLVVELASNDGYLLQYFSDMSIPVLGVEPCKSVAEAAIQEKGIRTEIEFFGRATAVLLREKYGAADLMAANNVLAHVPDINDFVGGVQEILAEQGVMTFEFPHLMNLIEFNQFDTIYHEHFSYLSLLSVKSVVQKAGLRVFDVEKLPTHGGSLRVFVCHEAAKWRPTEGLSELEKLEDAAGLADIETYKTYAEKVRETKRSLLTLLIELKRQGKVIVGYGAPAKGNTLLNYCGIGADMLEFTVDRAPSKQGMYLPGTRLPILKPEAIAEVRPDYVLILPWNLKSEIMTDMAHIREWGGQFIVPIPSAKIVA